MEAIKDTVINVIRNLEAKKTGVADNDPQELLKKVLTKKELGHIKFNYFRKGVLGLRVDSSSWLYNLNLKKESLLEKLKKCSSGVKSIRFNIGD
ncbi:MAG: DciA family protein [Candidatus Omnitrophota bacterium]